MPAFVPCAIAAFMVLLTPLASNAQTFEPPRAEPVVRPQMTQKALARALGLPAPGSERGRAVAGPDDDRRCSGCPVRHVGAAFATTAVINLLSNVTNHARGHATANIGPSTWGRNLKNGFEWDQNSFVVNQVGHPYQGSTYFTAGRAYGMSFWESAMVAAFGSGTWEYFWENNPASFNDFINSTLGGMALGEMFHRTAWLVRNPRTTGRKRFVQELAAAPLDPLTSAVRLLSGDWSRVSEKPEELVPTSLTASGAAGLQWQGTTAAEIDSTAKSFVEIDLLYGDASTGRSRVPYDAFSVRFRLGGGGSVLSDGRVRGRLLGRSVGPDGLAQLTVAQTYDYVANRAYSFSGQGFEISTFGTRGLWPGYSVRLSGWGGVTVLGAVDSRFPPPHGGAPVSEPPRMYDYGGGSTFGGSAQVSRDGRQLGGVSYQGYQIYVVDGFRANHIMQRLQLDVLAPLPRRLALGVSAEFFHRQTHFQTGGERRDTFSQLRMYVTRTLAETHAPARPAPPPTPTAPSTATGSRLWISAGGGFGSARVGCDPCERDGTYRRTRDLSVDAGIRVNPKLDVGGEIAWMPISLERGEPIWTTFLLGVAQFRPWASHGFFVKGGMGLGFVRNWSVDLSLQEFAPQVTTNAMALSYGAGWTIRPERRIAVHAYGMHHVAALGDLTTTLSTIQNVVSNFWTIGAGLTIR
jgi:hypothetical protein